MSTRTHNQDPSMRYESEKVARHLALRTFADTGNSHLTVRYVSALTGTVLLWFLSIGLMAVSTWTAIAVWIVSLAALFAVIGAMNSHAVRVARAHNRRVDDRFEESMRRTAQQ